MPNLVKSEPTFVSLLKQMGVNPRNDTRLRVYDGVIDISEKRPDGSVRSRTIMADCGVDEETSVAGGMSSAQRRKAVRRLYKRGLRQTAIARLLGVSQATVSNDLKP